MSMRFENPLQMLRLLKGAPLSVMFALLLARRTQQGSVGQEWIERNTGYTDKPVSQALALLEDYGLVRRNTRYGWVLTGAAMQLPLMGELLEEGDEGAAAALEAGSPQVGESELFRVGEIPTPLESSSSLTNQESSKEPLPESRTGEESEKIRVVQALREAGIREPAQSRLANLGHVTVDLVRYHCRTSQGTGQAIYRIEKNWPVKESPGLFEVEIEQGEPPGEAQPVEVSDEERECWARIQTELERVLSQGDYRSWVSCARLLSVKDGCYQVGTGNSVGMRWLEENTRGMVVELLQQITGQPARVEFVIWQ